MTMQYTAPLTADQVQRLGDDVGRIVAFTARALNREYPHLAVERLVESFTLPSVLEVTAGRYLAALERGATAGDAAGWAGAALIRDWAEARLEACEGVAGGNGD
ncbi:hypothetical protein [Streptomyces sp. NPDC093707]|uniref:hypothetical protein n=1 Tax=Streptomyces sp. NPDC093707 TaxID=3154984 RepID=UPI00344FAD84